MTQMSIREGKLENDSTDLERLLGRKPASVKEALQTIISIMKTTSSGYGGH